MNHPGIDPLIDLWLAEDVGHGDLTTQLMVPPEANARFAINAREPLTLAGIEVAARVFARVDPSVAVRMELRDGETVAAGTRLAAVEGRAQAILTAERTALNILQHLSGIATLTAAYVAAIEGTGARLADTRKTTPGLRGLEKYAVRCGGGQNHRLALDGGVMLKDNHIALAGSIDAAVQLVRRDAPLLTKIEVECESLEQVAEAVEAGADVIMLDNMADAAMREAVALVAGRALVECSGGVRLETIRAKAQTGVDVISVGRITQSAPACDIGLDADP